MKRWSLLLYCCTLIYIISSFFSCHPQKQLVTTPPKAYLKIDEKKKFKPISDEKIIQLMKEHQIEAASISYVLGNRKYEHKAYQLSEMEGLKVDSNSLFQAADISKTIAVLSLLPLVEDQQFTLEKDMRPFAEKLGIKNNFPDNYMALRNVIKHRGGFNLERIGPYTQRETLPLLDQMIKGEKPAKNNPLEVSYAPFQTHPYSDGGYLIVQKQIENTMKLSFRDYCDQYIFNTIGMRSSSFVYPKHEDKVIKGNLANGNPPKNGYYLYPAAAANGLWCSSADLAKLLHFFLLDSYGNSKLISGGTALKMIGDQLGINYNLQHNSISYYGMNEAYTSHFSGSLVNKRGMAIMCNSGNGGQFIDAIYQIINEE